MNFHAYKACAVPLCTSTTIKTPEKLFIHVPQTVQLRQKWLQLARRDHETVSPKYSMYFCEDHFDMPNDMENYMVFKIMGSVAKIRMKPHCLPSKFDCQQDQKDQKKRVSTSMMSTSLQSKKQRTMLMCNLENREIKDLAEPSISNLEIKTKAVQKCPTYETKRDLFSIKSKYRSKNTQTYTQTFTKATFTDKPPVRHKKVRDTKMTKKLLVPIVKESEVTPSGSQHILSSLNSVQSSSTSDSSNPEAKEGFEQDIMPEILLKYNEKKLLQIAYQNTLQLIKNKPRLFLGIPEDCFYLVDIIKKYLQIPECNILLCLQKIRLDKPFSELGDIFGISKSYASKIFEICTPKIAGILSNFIIKSTKAYVQFPVAFRPNCNKIACIIDCLEIEIQKPSHAIHQALTWSDYQKANTVKYLISSTPDGIINYVSPGFTGRTSDTTLVENSDFLIYLEPGSCVLADRGFKHIEPLLLQNRFQLVRPPSVYTSKMTKIEAQKITEVDSLRNHMERVIRRLREFSMLRIDSMVNSNLLTYLDECVIIACALINVHSLFRCV